MREEVRGGYGRSERRWAEAMEGQRRSEEVSGGQTRPDKVSEGQRRQRRPAEASGGQTECRSHLHVGCARARFGIVPRVVEERLAILGLE